MSQSQFLLKHWFLNCFTEQINSFLCEACFACFRRDCTTAYSLPISLSLISAADESGIESSKPSISEKGLWTTHQLFLYLLIADRPANTDTNPVSELRNEMICKAIHLLISVPKEKATRKKRHRLFSSCLQDFAEINRRFRRNFSEYCRISAKGICEKVRWKELVHKAVTSTCSKDLTIKLTDAHKSCVACVLEIHSFDSFLKELNFLSHHHECEKACRIPSNL